MDKEQTAMERLRLASCRLCRLPYGRQSAL